jgi:hypothetical protein
MPQVWVALPDGLNIYLNQQWVNYTGLSLESYGNGWIKSFHPDDQKCIRCLAKCHCNNTAYSLECRMRNKMVLIFGG